MIAIFLLMTHLIRISSIILNIFGHFQRQADNIGFTFSVEYDKLTIVKANIIGVALTDI